MVLCSSRQGIQGRFSYHLHLQIPFPRTLQNAARRDHLPLLCALLQSEYRGSSGKRGSQPRLHPYRMGLGEGDYSAEKQGVLARRVEGILLPGNGGTSDNFRDGTYQILADGYDVYRVEAAGRDREVWQIGIDGHHWVCGITGWKGNVTNNKREIIF